MEEKSAIIYSTPTCPFCNMVRDYLLSKGVEVTVHDVLADKEKAKEMIAKSGQRGVPVTEIDGNIIVGYNTDRLDKALAMSKKCRDAAASNIIFDPFDQ